MTERNRPVRSLSEEQLLEQLRNTLWAIKAMKRGNGPALQKLRRHWRTVRDELDRRAAEAGPKGGRPKGSVGKTTEGEEG
jgi:hypothetical protein